MSDPVIINVGGFAAFKGRVKNITQGLKLAATAMRRVTQMFYIAKNAAEPNKMAGKRVNYWANVGRSVTPAQSDGANSAFIAITDPTIWQKIKGGTIIPKIKKWLTIAANALAYGKPAGSFNLRFIKLSPTKAMLITKEKMTRAKRWKSQRADGGTVNMSAKFGRGQVMYWLHKSITQRKTPGALPPRADLQRAANEQFGIWLEGQKS